MAVNASRAGAGLSCGRRFAPILARLAGTRPVRSRHLDRSARTLDRAGSPRGFEHLVVVPLTSTRSSLRPAPAQEIVGSFGTDVMDFRPIRAVIADALTPSPAAERALVSTPVENVTGMAVEKCHSSTAGGVRTKNFSHGCVSVTGGRAPPPTEARPVPSCPIGCTHTSARLPRPRPTVGRRA